VTNKSSDFWAGLDETVARIKHDLALRGLERVTCEACKGTGQSEPGRSDYDAHGSYWVSAVPCRHCQNGRAERPCKPKAQAAAIRKEIARLTKQLETLEGL
jgi:DnaJ-class molecular chaperone